jgi:hypothetical protein
MKGIKNCVTSFMDNLLAKKSSQKIEEKKILLHFLHIPEILSFVYNDVNSERSVEHSEIRIRIREPSRRGFAFKVSFLPNNLHDNCSKKLDCLTNCGMV